MANFVNAITALAALSATGAAWWGLFSWKSQKKWDENRDLGKRYAGGVFDLRGVVNAATGNGSVERYLPPDIVSKSEDKPMAEREYWYEFYETLAMLREVEDCKFKLDGTRDEAIAVWGPEVESWHDSIQELLVEMNATLKMSLMTKSPNAGDELKEKFLQRLAGRRSIKRSFSDQETGREFSEAFSGEIDVLRAKIISKMN